MHIVRTQLSVLDHKLFKLFLSANDMEGIIVGDYEDRINNYQIDNKICYTYSDTDEKAVASMIYISLKYGSVEQAFTHFRNKIINTHIWKL